MEKTRKFDWRILVLILGLVFSLALIVIFTFRGLSYVPRHRAGEPIRPWMSVPYLAHSYHIPTHVLFQALGLPDNRHDRRPIAEIAREQHRTVQSLIQVLYQTIVQAHPTVVPPTPAPLNPTRSIP